ncbi:1-acyl-sn-glycerol-3-phosphate acyltransferase [Paraprevotella clara]|uniref:1-acyl-sn-glycerol-3-phosphate acyltransferase n=1 Tax=Paraprevotella clara TaxID=454154 RepID=UPI00265D25C5|nr:1-acyl-sn-glycerol-3-phosphate acyltransferase [Paraprevotella clara]
MPDKAVTLIDLDDIIRTRAGKKAKYIPGFLINGLKRLIHQDFINEYLRQGYVGVDFCEHTLAYLDVKVKVDGLENISDLSRKYTFVSNHPLGAIDGVTLGMVLGRHYDGKIKYLVNDLLMNLKGLAPLCVPINKLGKQARNFPQMVENTFRSDDQVIMFPAGICSRRMKDGSIRDLAWNKTFIVKSVATRRDVVPIHFIGQNSDRFYSIAEWCKRLHLKFNLAMLFLPDEMYRSRHGEYRVVIGKPIPWSTFDKSKSPQQWAQEVKEQVYKL